MAKGNDGIHSGLLLKYIHTLLKYDLMHPTDAFIT